MSDRPGSHGGYQATRTGDGATVEVTLHGKPVATVALHPDAGHHHYTFHDPPHRDGFLATAYTLFPDALEPDDVLVDRLVAVADLNAGPATVFELDDDDYLGGGKYRTYGPNVTFEQTVDMLLGPHRPGGDVVARVWVRDRSAFVPVTDLQGVAGHGRAA